MLSGDLSSSLGSVFSVLASFSGRVSYYSAKMAFRYLGLRSCLLRIQREENVPFPNLANVPELSVIDQAQVTCPHVS